MKRTCILASLFLAFSPTYAQVEQGLARNYPGDAGIESHPAVVFVEGFEESTIGSMTQRWDEAQRSQYMTFSTDVPSGSAGGKSLSAPGTGEGPSLYRRVLPGYDQLYLRYYAKFDPSCSNVDHFSWIGGHNPATNYPWPRAGQKPSGSSHFSTGVEPQESWDWDYYTYWQDMTCWGPDTSTQCHGNIFLPNASRPDVVRGEWFSLELMVKMNTVGSSNGEQAFWINGRKYGHMGPGFPTINGSPFPGFRWRSVNDLKANYVWLYMYTPNDSTCRVWLDNVVVATEYIGPMAPQGQAGTKPNPPTNLTVN